MSENVMGWKLQLRYMVKGRGRTRRFSSSPIFIYNDYDSEQVERHTYEGVEFQISPLPPPSARDVFMLTDPDRVPFHFDSGTYQLKLTAVFGDGVEVPIMSERVSLNELMELDQPRLGMPGAPENTWGTTLGNDMGLWIRVWDDFTQSITLNSVPVPLVLRLRREQVARTAPLTPVAPSRKRPPPSGPLRTPLVVGG